MTPKELAKGAAGLVFWAMASNTSAANIDVDATNPSNGILDIYSSTFDGPLVPPADPFFGGTRPLTMEIVIDPTPTGVISGVAPLGINPTPVPGSFLDLTLGNSNTEITLQGGTISFPDLSLTVSITTEVLTQGAGMVFDASPVTVADGDDGSVDGVFVLNGGPPFGQLEEGTKVDFSSFSVVAPPQNCSGPLCGAISVLTLDMVRYRLTVDWDPTFTFFTAEFIGQTSNNSMVFATLNSGLPDITVTTSVDFGAIIKDTVAEQTVTVTNDGLTDLVIGQIAQANPLAPPFSILTDNCSAQRVAPGVDCTFKVQFAPTTTGNFPPDSFEIPSNDPDMPTVTVSVSGTGVAPVIMVTDTVPFGSVTVNPPTPPENTVTISNGGDTGLVLGQISQPAAPFSLIIDNCSAETLSPIGGPNNSCTLTVQFNPSTAGPQQDSFDIPSNDPDTPTATVNVSGTGTASLVAKITVTDTLDFGPVIETTTADQTVAVTSSGTLDLEIFAIAVSDSLSAPFSILTDNCSMQILPPDNTCILTVRFAPTGTGLEQDSFDIPSSDLDTPTATVNVSGTGAPAPVPEITVDPLDIPFGAVIETMSADATVTVTNSGTADLVLDQITMAGPAGPFSVENDTCSIRTLPPLPPDNRCTLTIRFAPPATGLFNGSVDIPSNDPNAAIVTVNVAGTGAPGPVPDINPLPPADDLLISFGDVTEATAWDRTVTISNDGNANLVIGMIAQIDTLLNSFSILNDNCSNQIIAPAAICRFEVRFLPVRVDSFSDSFDIPSNDPDEPSLTFRVRGSGVAVGEGTIPLQPDGADSGLFGSAIKPATLLALLGLVAANLRRRKNH